MVVWEDWMGYDQNTGKINLYGKRVSSEGEVIDQERQEVAVDWAYNKTGEKPCFDLASFEDPNIPSCYIVWQGSFQDPTSAGLDILGRLIYEDPNGGDLHITENPMQLPILFDQYYPSVDSLGTDFLIVWENWRDEEGTDTDIWGIIVDALGNIKGNPINVSSESQKQQNPEITKNGQGYFVVWHDRRDVPSEHIYGVRISPEGLVYYRILTMCFLPIQK